MYLPDQGSGIKRNSEAFSRDAREEFSLVESALELPFSRKGNRHYKGSIWKRAIGKSCGK